MNRLKHKDEPKADFKYYAKVPISKDKDRYFYSKEAYQAYLDGLKKTTAPSAAATNSSQMLTTSKSTDRTITNKSESIGKTDKVSAGKSFVEKLGDFKFDKKDLKNLVEKATTFVTSGVVGLAINEFFKEDQPVESFDDLDKKTKTTTKEQDQAYTNPKYYTYDYAYTQNCTYCTAAYDLRQRGYDVEAMGIDETEAITTPDIVSWYDGITLDDVQQLYDVVERAGLDPNEPIYQEEAAELIEQDILEQYEEGAYGHFLLYWANGQGGHDVIWEIQNGKVILRDCQSNETLNIIDYLQYANAVEWFRSDNLKLNEKILKTVKNRRD